MIEYQLTNEIWKLVKVRELNFLVTEYFVNLFAKLAHGLWVLQEVITHERQCTCDELFRKCRSTSIHVSTNLPDVVSWPSVANEHELTIPKSAGMFPGLTSNEESKQLQNRGPEKS